MPFLFQHTSGAYGGTPQVGLIEDIRVEDDRVLRGELRFGAHPDAAWIRADMLSGIRKKVSVGYIPDRNNVEKTQGETDKLPTVRVMRWMPLECSTVSIPADPTVGVGRSAGDDNELARTATKLQQVLDRIAARGDGPGGKAPVAEQEEESVKDNDAARNGADPKPAPAPAAAATVDRDAERDRAEAIRLVCSQHAELCNEQGGPEQRALDFIIAGTSFREVRETLLGEARARLKPTDPTDRTGAPAVHTESRTEQKPEKGLIAARMILALTAQRILGERADKWAEKRWGDGEYIRALSSSNVSQGGAFIQPQFSTDFIELLRPMSAVRKLNPMIVPMESGSLPIPKLTGGSAASYIGENTNLPKTEPTSGFVQATAKKCGAVIPISNDWLRRQIPGADAMVRDDGAAALGQRSDLAFIRGAGSSYSPKGIRYWATAANVLSMTATPTLAKVTSDLGRLTLALKNGDVRMIRPGWIFAPRTEECLLTIRDGNGNFAFREEMLQGRLRGWPYATTTQVPINLGSGSDESEIYLADFADVVIAEVMGLQIEVFPGGTYHDGSQLQSGISLDQTVIQLIAEHDLVMRHDASVAVLTGVTWAPGAP